MRDLYHSIGHAVALVPAVREAAATGPAIYRASGESVLITVVTGAITGAGDFGVKWQEAAVAGGPWTDASPAAVISTAPATLAASTSYKMGYNGVAPFVRLALTKAGGDTIAVAATASLAVLIRPAA